MQFLPPYSTVFNLLPTNFAFLTILLSDKANYNFHDIYKFLII